MRGLGNKNLGNKIAPVVNLCSLFPLYRRVKSMLTAGGAQDSKLWPAPW